MTLAFLFFIASGFEVVVFPSKVKYCLGHSQTGRLIWLLSKLVGVEIQNFQSFGILLSWVFFGSLV